MELSIHKDSIVAQVRASGHRSAIWQSDHFNYESIYTVRNQVFLSFPAVGTPVIINETDERILHRLYFLGSRKILTKPSKDLKEVKTKSIKKTTQKHKIPTGLDAQSILSF